MFDPTLGACKDKDPNLFYPEGTNVLGKIVEAKQICSSCPIAMECFQHAMSQTEWGIWGGTTKHERALIRRSPSTKRRVLIGIAAGNIPLISTDTRVER